MILSINAINVSYGKVPILKSLSLDVPEKAIVTVLGANGAGKSTLMRTIVGLVKPTSGEITFNGKRIDHFSTAKIMRGGIALVPEERQIFPQMSVYDNLQMGAYIRKDSALIKKDEDQVYSMFPILSDRRKQLACTLSGGEQQMLVIGRALMARPKLILFDEPSFGLSPAMIEIIFDAISKLNKDGGLAILLVEQNAHIALSVSNYGYIMETGEIKFHNTADKLKDDVNVKKIYLGE